MPTPLEAEISSLLRESKSPQLIADDLLHRWRHRMLNTDEQEDCAQFLINAGLHSLLFQHVCFMISDRAALPWAHFVEAMGLAKLKLDELELNAVLEGAEAQNALKVLVRSRQLDDIAPTLKPLRDKLKEEQSHELEKRLQELIEKLQFMRSNRLFEQEAEVIKELQCLFPDHEGAAEALRSFELRWAREIIAKSTANSDHATHEPGGLSNDQHWQLSWKLSQLTPEQLKAKEMIVQNALDFVRKTPALGYDLALGLNAMEFHSEALEVLTLALENGFSSHAAHWLRLELMLSARQFISALEEARRLELNYASDPETSFAAVYVRARALRGLGQTSMAVELLRSLVRIRPNYKSAQSLLLDWSGGES